MAKPINKYDKCGRCGHSLALDHKSSWGTLTCDSCERCKGCNRDNGWGTEPINEKAKRITKCKTCGKKLYKDGYGWSHIAPIHSSTLKSGVSLGES